MAIDIRLVHERLQPASEMLSADGYSLEAVEIEGVLELTIVAGPSACADCLVPQDLMSSMLADMLGGEGGDPPIMRLRYPPGSVIH